MVEHAKVKGEGARQVNKEGRSATAHPASIYSNADMPPGGDWSRAHIRHEMDPKKRFHTQEPRKPGP